MGGGLSRPGKSPPGSGGGEPPAARLLPAPRSPPPPRATHRRRVACLMPPPPPASFPGSRARREQRASRLLRIPPRAATANTILLLFSRALSIPPHTPHFPLPPLPSSAGRLIPRYTAGFRAETERASPAARRAGGRAGDRYVLPQHRSPRRAGSSAYSEGRPPPALFCSWPGTASRSPANHHLAAPLRTGPRHLGGAPTSPQSHAHLPPTDLPRGSPRPPARAASTSALG